MKLSLRRRAFSILVLMLLLTPAAVVAQGPEPPLRLGATQPDSAPGLPPTPQTGDDALQPDWEGYWVDAADAPFAFTRFDAEYNPKDIRVYFMGGRTASGATDGSVWSLTAAGVFTDTGVDLVTPVSNYTINLLEDDGGWGFYTFCGRDAAGGFIDSVQIYYPDTNTAVKLAPVDDYPGSGTCTGGLNAVYDNKVYVAGGFDSGSAPYNWGETWVFDPLAPAGSRWTQLPTANLSIPRAYMSTAVVNAKIYAIGGSWYDPSGTLCGDLLCSETVVEVLDPSGPAPAWNDAAVADLPERCSEGRAFGFDTYSQYRDIDGTPFAGRIVSTCGGWPSENANVYALDTARNRWREFPSLRRPRRDQAAAFIPLGKFGLGLMMMWGGRSGSDANLLATPEGYTIGAGGCPVLLVDDDWDFDPEAGENDGGRPYYESAINQLGHPYKVWDTVTQGTPTAAAMAAYSATVWFTGYDWQSPISPTEESELISFMEGGGHLVMSSQEQEYAFSGSTIMRDYLRAQTVFEDVVLTETVGNASDPLFSGLGPYTLVRPDDVVEYWPSGTFEGPYNDAVVAWPGAFEPLIYGSTGQASSTRYDSGSYKTFYMAFPLEWVDTIQQRAEILGTALSWMCPIMEPIYLPLVLKGT